MTPCSSNCGFCGNTCAGTNTLSSTCVGGQCTGVCLPNFADCNNNFGLDGCEANLQTSTSNCGGCNRVCSTNNMASTTCVSGTCTGICNSGFSNCDSDFLTNGCETSTSTDVYAPSLNSFDSCSHSLSLSLTHSLTPFRSLPQQQLRWLRHYLPAQRAHVGSNLQQRLPRCLRCGLGLLPWHPSKQATERLPIAQRLLVLLDANGDRIVLLARDDSDDTLIRGRQGDDLVAVQLPVLRHGHLDEHHVASRQHWRSLHRHRYRTNDVHVRRAADLHQSGDLPVLWQHDCHSSHDRNPRHRTAALVRHRVDVRLELCHCHVRGGHERHPVRLLVHDLLGRG